MALDHDVEAALRLVVSCLPSGFGAAGWWRAQLDRAALARAEGCRKWKAMAGGAKSLHARPGRR